MQQNINFPLFPLPNHLGKEIVTAIEKPVLQARHLICLKETNST